MSLNTMILKVFLLVAAGFDAASVAGGTRAWIESGRAVGVGL